jgi:hypothetical protein
VVISGEKRAKAEDQRAAVAAFDRMCAARPLKPPHQTADAGPTETAGALAARKDKRLGILQGTTFVLGRYA